LHGTTVLAVRRNSRVVIGGDGQVTLGGTVMKGNARKVRRLYQNKVIAGFAGGTADAFTLFERFEGKLEKHGGNLTRAAVELAKDWRTDRLLRRLEAEYREWTTKLTTIQGQKIKSTDLHTQVMESKIGYDENQVLRKRLNELHERYNFVVAEKNREYAQSFRTEPRKSGFGTSRVVTGNEALIGRNSTVTYGQPQVISSGQTQYVSGQTQYISGQSQYITGQAQASGAAKTTQAAYGQPQITSTFGNIEGGANAFHTVNANQVSANQFSSGSLLSQPNQSGTRLVSGGQERTVAHDWQGQDFQTSLQQSGTRREYTYQY